MSDDFENRLQRELARRMVAPPAPNGLYEHVRQLGRPGASVSHSGRLRGSIATLTPWRALSGLAAAVGLIAAISVGLAWSLSPAASLASTPASPSISTSTATPTASRPLAPTWTGAAPMVGVSGRTDTDFGWATTMQKLYVTDDGGASWHDRTPAALAGEPLIPRPGTTDGWACDVTFVDHSHGWLEYQMSAPSHKHLLYGTTDGGATWHALSLPPFMQWTCGSLAVDAEHLVRWNTTAADTTEIWLSDDGGASWTGSDTTTAPLPALGDLRPVSPTEMWATSSPTVLHTLDGGRTWSTAKLPQPPGIGDEPPLSVYEYPTRVGPALVMSGVIWPTGMPSRTRWVTWQSVDDGATWTITRVTDLTGRELVGFVHALGAAVLYESAARTDKLYFLSAETGAILGTSDVSKFCAGTYPGTLSEASPSDMWFTCRDRAGLYGTTDGGRSWLPLMGTPAG